MASGAGSGGFYTTPGSITTLQARRLGPLTPNPSRNTGIEFIGSRHLPDGIAKLDSASDNLQPVLDDDFIARIVRVGLDTDVAVRDGLTVPADVNQAQSRTGSGNQHMTKTALKKGASPNRWTAMRSV